MRTTYSGPRAGAVLLHTFQSHRAPGSFIIVALVVLAAFTLPAAAQTGARITGTVRTSDQTPVTDATVTLLELRRSTTTDAAGAFRFENVPPGQYHLSFESRRSGTTIAEADVEAGTSRVLDVVLDPAIHSEEIVVSASPDARGSGEVYQAVAVVDQQEIAAQLQPTIGETLSSEPGVSSTYFGPGSSRPIIRGFGADRIRILSGGLGSADASNVSPDHAVSIDPANAEQIEIVRGPATLLYGSNAVGGVVNVIDNRIPETLPGQPVTGHVDLRGGTVADERTGSFSLTGGLGQVAWHLDYLDRETGDYEIPGYAQHQHEGEEPDEHDTFGILENSSMQSTNGTIGASWIGSRGYVGLSYNEFDTNYGIPGGGHHHEEEEEESSVFNGNRILQEEEEEEEFVRIDLTQQRFDFRGALNDLGFFRNVSLRAGQSEYEHVELEGEEVGTLFLNDGFEARLEATHVPLGRVSGSIGAQFSDSDFAAVGEEAFVPPNSTEAAALFIFEELRGERWDFLGGARYESYDVSAAGDDLPDRSFDGLSASVGTLYRPVEGYAIAASLARGVRLPTATELYANGAHIATAQFEIGDPALDKEISVGLDLAFRKTAGRIHGEVNLFNNEFDGFIYDRPTGEFSDGLPIFQFVQADARFRGAEIDTHTELWHSGANHLELELGADYVRATLDDGSDLPRIPPLRTSIGLRFEGAAISASAEARRYAKQDEVAQHEEPTDGYTLVGASVGYRFFIGDTIHDLLLRGTNLLDEEARVHASALKERAPLPGRDFSLAYRLTF